MSRKGCNQGRRDFPESIPEYRKCRNCHATLGGVGVCKRTDGRVRYYKCDKCPETWIAWVKTTVETIHRDVTLKERGEG